jgi:hypothetical protein
VAFVALLDASVLHPWVVCDLLLRLAERGLYRPGWSAEILDELVKSLIRRQPDHEEQFRRWRERMEAAFAEAMTNQPGRFTSAVPDEVDAGDRHVVAAAFAVRADVIVTNNVRHFAPDKLAEVGLLVHWWMSPSSTSGGSMRRGPR